MGKGKPNPDLPFSVWWFPAVQLFACDMHFLSWELSPNHFNPTPTIYINI
jgi:hypothetical protein